MSVQRGLATAGVAALLGAGGVARADDNVQALDHGLVALGVTFGGGHGGLEGGFTGEAVYPVALPHAFAHALIGYGGFDSNPLFYGDASGDPAPPSHYYGATHYYQVRAGVEGRWCAAYGTACVILGADLGVLRSGQTHGPNDTTPSARYTELMGVPRIGVDLGRDVRVRLTLDVTVASSRRIVDGVEETGQGLTSVLLGAAIAGRL